MLTQEEKKMLIDLLNAVQVSGNRQQIKQTLEKLDALTRKVEAMPTADETPGKQGPSQPIKTKKK